LARPLLTKAVTRDDKQKKRVDIEFPNVLLRTKGEGIEAKGSLPHLNE